MRFASRPVLSRILVAGLCAALGACSAASGGGSAPALPSAPGAGVTAPAAQSAGHRRHPRGLATVTATVLFSPTTAKVGVPVEATIKLISLSGTDASFAEIDDALPSVAGGQMQIVSGSLVPNGCGGSLTAVPGTTTVTYLNAVVPGSTGCTFSFWVEGTGAGTYTDSGLSIPASASSLGPKLEYNIDSQSLVTTPPGDHLYVPVIPSANSGSVEMFAEGISGPPVCSFTSIKFPNPIAVAASPFDGTLYVLDSSHVLTEVPYSTTPCGGNNVPKVSITVSSAATALTVDSNNDVVLAACTRLLSYGYNTASHTFVQKANYLATTGDCVQDVSANPTAQVLYASIPDPTTPVVEELSTAAAIPTSYCSAPEQLNVGGSVGTWHISAGGAGYFYLSDSQSVQTGPIVGGVPTAFISMNTDCTQDAFNPLQLSANYVNGLAYDPTSGSLVWSTQVEKALHPLSTPPFKPLLSATTFPNFTNDWSLNNTTAGINLGTNAIPSGFAFGF